MLNQNLKQITINKVSTYLEYYFKKPEIHNEFQAFSIEYLYPFYKFFLNKISYKVSQQELGQLSE